MVDTHVCRVASRLGWVEAASAAAGAEAIRIGLERWVPFEERVAFSLSVVGFGQHARGGQGWGRAFVEHVRRTAGCDADEAARHGADGVEEHVDEAPYLVALAQSMVVRMDSGGAGSRCPWDGTE